MTRISYRDFITEYNGQLRVPMTPAACKSTGCHTYFWTANEAGRREAVAKAKVYAAYLRRDTEAHAQFDFEQEQAKYF